MRPLTQITVKVKWIDAAENRRRGAPDVLLFLITLTAGAWLQGYRGGSPVSVAPPPPPPPPSISVTVTPMSGSVLLGSSQTLTAMVTNTTETSVTWAVNGVQGGSASTGTITADGIYTAPGDLPSPAKVQVTATSQADKTKSATAQLTITSDIAIAIAPPNANAELGATQGFHAAIACGGRRRRELRSDRSDARRERARGRKSVP